MGRSAERGWLRFRRHPLTVWGAYTAFFLLFAWLLWRSRSAVATLASEDAVDFLALLGLTLVMVGGRGLLNVITFRPFGAALGLGSGTGLAVIQTMGNYLPLSAGLVAKAVVLQRRYGVAYSSYGAVSVYTYASALAVSGAGGGCALWMLAPDREWLLGGFAVMTGAVFVPFLPVTWFLGRMFPREVGWRKSRRRFQGVLPVVWIVQGLTLVLAAGRMMLAFRVLDHPIGFASAVLLSTGAVLGRLVTLTPGGVGVREGIVATLGLVTGVDPALAVLAVGIDRLAEVLVVFSAGGLMSTASGGLVSALPKSDDARPSRREGGPSL